MNMPAVLALILILSLLAPPAPALGGGDAVILPSPPARGKTGALPSGYPPGVPMRGSEFHGAGRHAPVPPMSLSPEFKRNKGMRDTTLLGTPGPGHGSLLGAPAQDYFLNPRNVRPLNAPRKPFGHRPGAQSIFPGKAPPGPRK